MSTPNQFSISAFNLLMKELLTGTVGRNTFAAWEVEMLLDLQDCRLRHSNRKETLRRFQKAVNREFEQGKNRYYLLSDYLQHYRRRHRPVEENTLGNASFVSQPEPELVAV